MSLLQNLQDMLSQSLSGAVSGKTSSGLGLPGGLDGLLGPAALGGLLGALVTSKGARGMAGGALLAGTGAMLWNKYKESISSANADNPNFGQAPSTVGERAERLIRALVFAAKCDGHIDDKERQAIQKGIKELNIGPEAERLVQRAMDEPLDPALIANGVKSADEALEIYAVSCAVITPDHFMERSYLDALAKALNIPADVKAELESSGSA